MIPAWEKGCPPQYAGIIDEEFGREIIRRVDDEIVVLVVDDLGQCLGIDPFIIGDDMDVGIEPFQGMAGRIDLALPYRCRGMDDLALQIGKIDHVVIDDADGTDAGRCQIEDSRCTQSAGTDDQHLAGQELFLSFATEEDDIPGIPFQLLICQFHREPPPI